MKPLLIIASLLATTATTQAQQYLAPGPQGMRYYNYSNPGPYYRGVAPGPYYRGVNPGPYYRGAGPDIGDAIGAVIGTVVQNALRPRYVPPPQPVAETPPPVQQQRPAPTQDQWRQSLLNGAAAFCRQYPTDTFCKSGPDNENEDNPDNAKRAPDPTPPPPSGPARPYQQR
jgi:hypothetical protein